MVGVVQQNVILLKGATTNGNNKLHFTLGYQDCVFLSLDTLIGTVITQVTGNDVDSGPALSYSLLLDSVTQGKFGIHRYGGGVSLTAPLDFEDRTWYTLTVSSSDSKQQTYANLTVLVEDVNDNAPVFSQDLYEVC